MVPPVRVIGVAIWGSVWWVSGLYRPTTLACSAIISLIKEQLGSALLSGQWIDKLSKVG